MQVVFLIEVQDILVNIKIKENNGGIIPLIESKDFTESLKNSRNEFKNKILEKKLIKVGENSYKDPDSNPINVKPFESNNI